MEILALINSKRLKDNIPNLQTFPKTSLATPGYAARPAKGFSQSLRTVFQPGRHILSGMAHPRQRGIIPWPIFPVVFIHRKNVMGVKATSIQLPQGKCSTGAAVAVGEGMDSLETIMENGRAEDRRELWRSWNKPVRVSAGNPSWHRPEDQPLHPLEGHRPVCPLLKSLFILPIWTIFSAPSQHPGEF